MATINSLAEYRGAVFDICRLLHNGDSCAASRYKELMAAEKNTNFIAPIGYIVDSFSLGDTEALALCLCATSLWQNKTLPTLSELTELCGLQPFETHHIFSVQQDGSALSIAVRRFLMSEDAETPSFIRLHIPTDSQLFHSFEILDELQNFCSNFSFSQSGCNGAVVLSGKKGIGKTYLLTRLAQLNEGTLLEVDASLALPQHVQEIAITATLYRSIVCITNRDSGNYQNADMLIEALFKRLSLLFFEDEVTAAKAFNNTIMLKREVTGLTLSQRSEALKQLFDISNESEQAKNFQTIYNSTIGNLVSAKQRYSAEVLSGAVVQDDEKAILALIKDSCSGNLGDNATRTVTNKQLSDVVLPATQTKTLNEISSFIKNKRTVYEHWNFKAKIPYGRGITMLFYGSSGTGKTLAASAMANELGLDLYRVDLSRMISKYIGETQKNIGKIFDDAQKCDCILFFDEADALFSKRSDNSDAQDKYSNAEIAYLLQRTEHYDGAIILATNLLQNFDEAFRRRIDFMVHFPLPDEALRQKLWENIFPKEAPLEDINTGLLAKYIELSGAGIRNCAVNAALLAASEGGTISMNRVIRAAKMEYQKHNKQLPVNLLAMFTDD